MERTQELKDFYPLDLFAYSNGLTEGELTVLKTYVKF